MYRLTRLHDTPNPYVNPDETETGYVGIMNDLTWKNQLRSTIQDTLTTTQIKFPAYEAGELQTILAERAEQAFVDDVLDDDVIPLVSAITAQSSGSARVGLDMLYEAGNIARSQGDEIVTEKHVRSAEEEVLTSQIINDLRSQPLHGQIVMHAVLMADKQGNTPIPQSDLYTLYRSVAVNQWETDPQAKRSMDRRIRDLLSLGFVNVNHVNEGAGGGTHDEVMVGEVDADRRRDAIREEIDDRPQSDDGVSFEVPDPASDQTTLGS